MTARTGRRLRSGVDPARGRDGRACTAHGEHAAASQLRAPALRVLVAWGGSGLTQRLPHNAYPRRAAGRGRAARAACRRPGRRTTRASSSFSSSSSRSRPRTWRACADRVSVLTRPAPARPVRTSTPSTRRRVIVEEPGFGRRAALLRRLRVRGRRRRRRRTDLQMRHGAGDFGLHQSGV